MAKTALTQIEEQIELIRREAYEAGYSAAMQAICEFVSRPSAATASRIRRAIAPIAELITSRRRGAAKASGRKRPQRGSNARLIAEVLKAMPAGAGKPADIRRALQQNKGIVIAFTSIRHALGQLAARNQVAPSEDGAWHYLGS